MNADSESAAKARRVWDQYAARYDKDISFWERAFFGTGREWVCSRARGRVLEVGVGTGRNFPFYPADVTVVGVDVSPAMLDIARRRAAESTMDIELGVADAEALPFADNSFDTVLSTISLCAIPDHRAAIVEMSRVLRPGGRLLLLDHIGSNWWPIWAGQWLLELVTSRSAGEHMTRRPAKLLPDAGFRVTESQRSKAGTVERLSATKSG